MNWNDWYMSIARTVATKSKDPSTKVGAVLVRPDNTIAAVGYNGFPVYIEDSPERLNDRPTKLALTIHAEMNAIINAREPVKNYIMYSTLMPCDRCFVHLIQARVSTVVFPAPTAAEEERWGEGFARTRALAKEAGIILRTHG